MTLLKVFINYNLLSISILSEKSPNNHSQKALYSTSIKSI